MKKTVLQLMIATLLVFLSACATPPKYYWGQYETLIFSSYLKPGEISVPEAITILETDIEKAAANGKPVPPGLHAHLAVLLISNGDDGKAMHHFKMEKELFPESSHFIDGMIQRMKK